jgi:hypothetical protein
MTRERRRRFIVEVLQSVDGASIPDAWGDCHGRLGQIRI